MTSAYRSGPPRSIGSSANEIRESSAKERSVQVQISIGHAVYREALRNRRPAGDAIDLADTSDRGHGCIDAVDQETGHTGIDQVRHLSTVGRDDRRAAGERLHDRQSKRLIEVDEVEQRTC